MNFNIDFGNFNFISLLPLFLFAFLGIGLLIFGIHSWRNRSKRISARLEEFVVTDMQQQEPTREYQIISREISGSLFNRTIANWLNAIINLIGRFAPQNMIDRTNRKLKIAGTPNNLNALKFYSIRIFSTLIGIVFAFLFGRLLGSSGNLGIVIGILVIAVSIYFPIAWLNGKIKTRQDEIQRELPDALDMLSVCASAGLGFDQSMQKISDYWDTELGREFQRVMQEMEMGLSRSEALRNMSDRLDVRDLSQFIAIIVQAEKIGMSFAQVLHAQALQLRVARQVRAREIANKLPGKMIIPLVLFIFPAIIAVIIGPTIPVILDLF